MYRSFPANRAMKPLASSRPSDGESGELQRRDPALGAFLQGLDVPCREAQSRCFVEVRGGLVGRESQVGGPDLDQLAARPPSSQLQVGVGAGAEHDVDVGGRCSSRKVIPWPISGLSTRW